MHGVERTDVSQRSREGVQQDGRWRSVLATEPIERLHQMGQALGRDIPQRIIRLYLEDAPSRLAILRRSLAAGDAAGMDQAAHSLKGSSANLGALGLAELCDELELLCRHRVPATAGQRLSAMEDEYRRVEKAMRDLLAELD